MNNSESDRRTDPSIDALRGWMCLAVAAIHVWDIFLHSASAPPWSRNLYLFGTLLMNVFFCASGYLVFSSLHRRAGIERNFRLAFYIRRAARILPLWWLLLLVLYGLGEFGHEALFANLFFYFGFFSYDSFYLPLVVAWSLFVEEVFYLLLPIFFPFFKNVRNVITGLLVSLALAYAWLAWAPGMGVPEDNFFVLRSPIAKFPFFLFGILLFFLERIPRPRNEASAILGVLSPLVLGGFSFFCLFAYLSMSQPLSGFIAAPIIFLAAKSAGTGLSGAANFALLRSVGKRCYAIYLIHFPLLHFAYRHWGQLPEVISSIVLPFEKALILTPVVLTGSFLVAVILEKLIERPALKLGYRLATRIAGKNGEPA